MSEPIITFTDFSFRYKSQTEETLKHIDLTIYKGEKILILGPSGCGKSTLGNCINGLIPFSYLCLYLIKWKSRGGKLVFKHIL